LVQESAADDADGERATSVRTEEHCATRQAVGHQPADQEEDQPGDDRCCHDDGERSTGMGQQQRLPGERRCIRAITQRGDHLAAPQKRKWT
jgi:hypothetical protein